MVGKRCIAGLITTLSLLCGWWVSPLGCLTWCGRPSYSESQPWKPWIDLNHQPGDGLCGTSPPPASCPSPPTRCWSFGICACTAALDSTSPTTLPVPTPPATSTWAFLLEKGRGGKQGSECQNAPIGAHPVPAGASPLLNLPLHPASSLQALPTLPGPGPDHHPLSSLQLAA